MSIDCSNVEQFPTLVSGLNKNTKISNNETVPTTVVPVPTVVVGGPGSSEVTKTKSVNEVVGIPSYDLDSLIPEEAEWEVQRKRKGKKQLFSIEEEPADLLQFTEDDVKDELDAAKDLVLKLGHFLFDNKPLIVRPWIANVNLVKEEVKEVPVWVKIHNLPLKFWGKCLPKIAGLLGKFIRSDAATEEKTRLGFSRVMVEVPFGRAIPEKVKFLDEDGIVVSLKVDFEWKPILCKKCNGIGHETSKCKKPQTASVPQSGKGNGKKQEWRPKVKQATKVASLPVTPPVINPPEELVTPVEKPNAFQVSWSRNGKYHMAHTPARNVIRLSRQELLDKGQSKLGHDSFMENLNTATPKVGIGIIGSIGLFGLLETKVKPLSLNTVRTNLCAQWCITTNTHLHKGGKIWVLWNLALFKVQILAYHAQFIHLHITDIGTGYGFHLTMVYAMNDVVLVASERLGGYSTPEEMDDFNACIAECGITDSPAVGSLYTWSNKQDVSSRVYNRLDRVLVNKTWLDDNSEMYAHFYPEGIFDHTPCVVQTHRNWDRKRRSFKYLNMWSQADEFQNCVLNVWSKHWYGTRMYQLVCKLKALKRPLKQLSSANFNDIENNTARARMHLEYIQEQIRGDPFNSDLVQQELEASSSVRWMEKACNEFLL
ncbi:uncharacterized protein LOC141608117 [Silene latifolia]|uniref:uncharacterized protein LOC141608117 n=1 Tax=Silene latifolia TaxID=37657 RepID=UPI003D76B29A